MHKLYKLLLICLGVLLTFSTFAQNVDEKTDDFMRSDGKIYVVVVIVITILAGLIVYVARLDRKISRLEKDK